jgi:hypothetical protein
VPCGTRVGELKSGAMFFQQKKQASWGRENLIATAIKLFLTDSPHLHLYKNELTL